MKIANTLVTYILEKKKKNKAPVLRIETTNACNASCITCPRPKMKRPVATMDMDLFASIIDQGKEMGVTRVHLNNYGEPLLDKNLIKKIEIAVSRDMQVKIDRKSVV